jgi:glutamine amidotransferase
MAKFVAVIDYGLGNLRSVSKAIEAVGAQVKVTNALGDLESASALVLPGVGAFQRAMENLQKLNIIPAIKKQIQKGKPFLGICLGLQILFTESEEHGTTPGLNIIRGKVKRFSSGVKIPHMGWNALKQASKSDIFTDIADNSYFYFVHSYFVEPDEKGAIIGTTEYGESFASAVNKDNIWGVQFHPEKSHDLGLKVLEGFTHHVN